jgi:3-methyladenine DNA glycosylase AlkC
LNTDWVRHVNDNQNNIKEPLICTFNTMAGLLKDIYSKSFYESFSESMAVVVPAFDKQKFTRQIFDKHWASRELKDRMKHTSRVLNSFFPADFSKTCKLIEAVLNSFREKNEHAMSLELMFLPDYIESYGINYFSDSVKAMEFVTQFTSCEFAVRPFIIKYGEKMLLQMLKWSLHKNHHVRRLASEGSRPRLPWAIALPELKRDPSAILPILENLKNDPSEYVRRSVANSLNDISKDNPAMVIAIAAKWKGQSKETDAILKHASRTLLKQGNPVMLAHFNVADNPEIVVDQFSILTPVVRVGDYLQFAFSLQNTSRKPLNARIEYGLYYLRNNGQHSKKVFKISERELKPAEKLNIQRNQSFKIITTRKFYRGIQKLSIIINGKEREIGHFELTE